MSDGWTVEKEKAVFRNKSRWLLDSGLVLLYALFLLGCFLIGFAHRDLSDMQKWSNISAFLVILSSLCIGYILYDLKRTLVILSLGSMLGFALIYAGSVALFFHSYTSYSYRNGTDSFRKIFPAGLVLTFVIGAFFISILGAIAAYYTAERTRKGEKRLILRCYSCGSWNEQYAINCWYCGKKLNAETEKKIESKVKTEPSSTSING